MKFELPSEFYSFESTVIELDKQIVVLYLSLNSFTKINKAFAERR